MSTPSARRPDENDTASTILAGMEFDEPPFDGAADEGYPARRMPLPADSSDEESDGPSWEPEWSDDPEWPIGNSDSEPPPRQARRRPAPRAPPPQMDRRLLPDAQSLMREFAHETAGRGRLQTVAHDELLLAAETFVMYRSTSLAVIRQTDRHARRMFLTGLYMCTFAGISLRRVTRFIRMDT